MHFLRFGLIPGPGALLPRCHPLPFFQPDSPRRYYLGVEANIFISTAGWEGSASSVVVASAAFHIALQRGLIVDITSSTSAEPAVALRAWFGDRTPSIPHGVPPESPADPLSHSGRGSSYSPHWARYSLAHRLCLLYSLSRVLLYGHRDHTPGGTTSHTSGAGKQHSSAARRGRRASPPATKPVVNSQGWWRQP